MNNHNKEDQKKKKYRHEYKYLCNGIENAVLKARVQGLMKRDSHCGEKGYYEIRSLYFDDLANTCYYENESGINLRAKYRIRIYNGDKGVITLEKKSKANGMTLKEVARMDEVLCRSLMRGQYPQSSAIEDEALKTLLWEMQQKGMRPAVIVNYIRYPFVEANGNVRVTFDECISSSNDIADFLESRIHARPILSQGMSVLEIKWDEFMPSYLKNRMEIGNLQWTSFSKYYLCRKYNAYGGIKI